MGVVTNVWCTTPVALRGKHGAVHHYEYLANMPRRAVFSRRRAGAGALTPCMRPSLRATLEQPTSWTRQLALDEVKVVQVT